METLRKEKKQLIEDNHVSTIHFHDDDYNDNHGYNNEVEDNYVSTIIPATLS